ncbi:hypothetical protein ACRAWD_25315 [Caulobacter segnis]
MGKVFEATGGDPALTRKVRAVAREANDHPAFTSVSNTGNELMDFVSEAYGAAISGGDHAGVRMARHDANKSGQGAAAEIGLPSEQGVGSWGTSAFAASLISRIDLTIEEANLVKVHGITPYFEVFDMNASLAFYRDQPRI